MTDRARADQTVDPGKGPRLTARVRIMGWLVLVMTAGLATVVLLVREFQVREIDDRVNRALEQDAEEFRNFAAGGHHPVTGRPVTERHVLLELHLRGQYTDSAEALLGVIDRPPGLDVLRQVDPSVRDVRLDDTTLRGLVNAHATTGTVSTAAGDMRWVKVGLLASQDDVARPQAWFVAAYFLEPARAEAANTVRTLVLVSAIALLLGAGVSWVVAGRILAPVRTVREAAAALTEDDLTLRIPLHGRDDIAALAEQFNAMLDRLERAFATRRQFLDDAGHELRTPITIIRGHLELMGDDPAERAEVVRLCTDELDRMARMVDDLLLLAKAEQPDFTRPHWVSVPELTSDVDAKVRAIADRRWVLETVAEGEAWLDAQRITQALAQLAHNAVQYTVDGDEIRLGSGVRDGSLLFWIRDHGPGVRQEDAQRIFERFTRGTQAARDGAGAGLGLAIVMAIATAHHGSARVLSQPGDGATFLIEIPLTPNGWRSTT